MTRTGQTIANPQPVDLRRKAIVELMTWARDQARECEANGDDEGWSKWTAKMIERSMDLAAYDTSLINTRRKRPRATAIME